MAQEAPQKPMTPGFFIYNAKTVRMTPQNRFVFFDYVWLIMLSGIAITTRGLIGGISFNRPDIYLVIATLVFIYYLGFRIRDRLTAFLTAALLSASPIYLATTSEPSSALFTTLTIGAMAAYASGWLIPAIIIAAGATILRPEGILLGAVILAYAITLKKPRAYIALALYVVLIFAGMAAAIIAQHKIPIITLGPNAILIKELFAVPTAIIFWFIWPMLAELAEPARRVRWELTVVWSVLYLAVESLFRIYGKPLGLGPFLPVLLLMAAGGIARLLPILAGDFPNPRLRYILAVLAIGTLIVARFRGEWSQAKQIVSGKVTQASTLPVHKKIQSTPEDSAHKTKTAQSHAIVPATTTITTAVAKPKPHPAAVIAKGNNTTKPVTKNTIVSAIPAVKPNTKLSAVKVPAVKTTPAIKAAPGLKTAINFKKGIPHHIIYLPPGTIKPKQAPAGDLYARAKAAGIPTTHVYRGHTVQRTRWAILWDLNHIKTPVVKPATVKTTHKATPKPATKPNPATPVKPAAKAAPMVKAKPAVKKTVSAKAKRPVLKKAHTVYRKRHRSIWAIRWERAHRKHR